MSPAARRVPRPSRRVGVRSAASDPVAGKPADQGMEAHTDDSDDGGAGAVAARSAVERDVSAKAAAAAQTDPEDAPPEPPQAELREQVVSPSEHGMRLDRLLVAMAPEFSRSHLQHLVERGHVEVEGRTTPVPARRVKAGERIRLELVPTDESLAFRPEPIPLHVLYEDPHLLVIDKPAGLVVHPAPGNWSGTVLNALLARDGAAALLPRAGIVHRLDKDTSGVMVIARTLPAMTSLARAIAAREVHRAYLALAHGVPPQAAFSIDAPVGRDPRSRVRMAVVGAGAGGRDARTDVRVLGSLAAGAGHGPVSALLCTLHTGRTHQIRVHLASIGHPLVADATYGGQPGLGLDRQALHARELRFAHPAGAAEVCVRAPLPADFAHAWARIPGATIDVEVDHEAAGRTHPPLRDGEKRRGGAAASYPPRRAGWKPSRRGP